MLKWIRALQTLSHKPTTARRFEQDWALAAAKAEHVRHKIDSIGDIDSRDITKTDLLQLHSCIASMNRIIDILSEIESEAV